MSKNSVNPCQIITLVTFAHFSHFSHFSHFRHFRHFGSLLTIEDPAPASPAPGRIGRNEYQESSYLRAYKAPGRPALCPLIRLQIRVRPKGLHSFAFYILIFAFSLLPSTSVENPLQIRPFMQNKANFRKSQMNVNKVLTRDYEKKTLGERGKNKPNTNPIQTQYKANSKPIQTQYKPNFKVKKILLSTFLLWDI